MELQEIQDAIKANPELVSGLLPTIIESEAGKKLVSNKVTAEVDTVITEKIADIHKRYDEDMFELLGERPERSDDGSKEKTYQKIKSLYGELKDLRGQKDSLSKDAEVKRLNDQIELLKTDNGSKQYLDQIETMKTTFQQKESEYQKAINNAKLENETFQKTTFINDALSKIKFDPDVKDSIRNMVIDNEKQRLISSSELRDGKLVFVKDGKVELDNTTFEPIDVKGKITSLESIRDISLQDEKKGGNAKPDVKVETKIVEGKDAKTLKLTPGSFKTKSEFLDVSTKALTDAGITRRDPDWQRLTNEAYKEHNVSALPPN